MYSLFDSYIVLFILQMSGSVLRKFINILHLAAMFVF